MIAKSNAMRKDFLTNLSSAQVSDRAEIIMVDCRVELVYYSLRRHFKMCTGVVRDRDEIGFYTGLRLSATRLIILSS